LNTRNFSGLNRERENGEKGELLARNYLSRNGWEILEEPKGKSYDFLIRKGTKTYAVNVKSGKNFVEPFKNFKRLIALSYPVALLYVSPENPPFFYLLPVNRLEDGVS
jgi:hypothetical protein